MEINHQTSPPKRQSAREKILAELQALREQFPHITIVTNKNEFEKVAGDVERQYTPKTRGAGYIRYSSKAQTDSFSLAAQMRAILARAESDNAEIVIVFADLAESAFHKKDRPAINAAMAAAQLHLFQILYAHKFDRLARRIEWLLEIIQKLDENNILLCAVEQDVDMSSPEGRMVMRMLGVIAQFYSENLSKETGKGRFEAAQQGYHNGILPVGYQGAWNGKHRVGEIHPELGPVVRELFERYGTGVYSDKDMMDWFHQQPAVIAHGIKITKDGIRELLQNPYYNGKIRYKGQKVPKKGKCPRDTPPLLFDGQHPALVSDEVYNRCQEVRTARASVNPFRRRTARIHLLQGIAICSECGAKLRAQTPKHDPSYYREPSDLRPGHVCSKGGRGAQTRMLEDQVITLIHTLHLPKNWEEMVQSLLSKERGGPDPEAERREIRSQLRRLRDTYELGQYAGEEFIYRQKVEALQQKLSLIQLTPTSAFNNAAQTLLGLSETWEWATRGEQQQLVRMMFSQVACDVVARQVVWVRPRLDFDILFRVVDGMSHDDQGRYWFQPTENAAEASRSI